MTKDWEPKTPDCYLITGGQIKRLRDAATQEDAQKIVGDFRHQKYQSGQPCAHPELCSLLREMKAKEAQR